MQLDRYDIQVIGSNNSAIGPLFFQPHGGAIVVHGSQVLDERVHITGHGEVGIATADPRQFAIDRGLIGEEWYEPPGALAVDGDIYAERIQSFKLDVLERLRIGRPTDPSMSGGSRDFLHVDSQLQVGGKISAQMIAVHADHWADDVFEADYPLMPLDALERYVLREHHLPGVPTQADVERAGIDLAEINEMLLRKVEELTLYTIDQEKRVAELERKMDALAR